MVFQSIGTPSAELEYVSDRDGGFKRSLERCKLLTRWAFEYFDQTEVCSGSSIADPIHASAGIREFRERVLRKKSVQLYAIFFFADHKPMIRQALDGCCPRTIRNPFGVQYN